MKNLTIKKMKWSILTIGVLFCFAFSITKNKLEKQLLQVGETIVFSNKPMLNIRYITSSMKVGAYDGTKFHLNIDSASNLSLSNLHQPNGPKQDDIHIFGCTGQMTRNEDNVTFRFEKCKNKYYLINLDSAKVVAIFDSISYLKVKSTNINGNAAEFYCADKAISSVINKSNPSSLVINKTLEDNTQQNISITAVPSDIKINDLYKAVHKENTLAYFSSIEFKVENNKILTFPKGNYILCEGNSFDLK